MNFTLLWHFVRQDFSDRYSGVALGRGWILVTPMLQILIFLVIFNGLIGPRIPSTQTGNFGYGIYLISGILPWTAFVSTVSRTTTVFFDKRAVLSKVPLSLTLVAVHIAVVEGITLVCTLSLFTILTFVLSVPPSPGLLVLPILILCQQLIAFSLGLMGAIAMVFLRDVKEMIGTVTMLWFWMCPIVYTIDSVPNFLQKIQTFNPAWWFLHEYRVIYVYGMIPDAGRILLLIAGSLLASGVMIWFLSRSEHQIRDSL